jgi:uncharacterized protein
MVTCSTPLTVLSFVVAGLVLSAGCATGASSVVPEVPSQPLQPVRFCQIKVSGFWKDQAKRLTEKWIPHCIQQMEKGGRGQELLNLVHTAKVLRGESAGKFTGAPWSDAYVYNTIESICLALAVDPAGDAELTEAQAMLRRKLDEWIPIVLAAQMEDGYIHSFHTVNKRPRYTNIRHHEFYVQGYFIEAGVAHYRMTGGKDRRLYDAARKCADQLCATFGPPPKRNWTYGHAGMGYALCRLSRLVNEVERPGEGDKYFQLAKFFFDHRHDEEKVRQAYHQSHLPVPEQSHAVGHAVRATYFYTGIADLAMLTGDEAYFRAVDRIWDSAVNRKLYITGGVGASHQGEAFDMDYELRNHGYCESCAGCGQSFWADRMHRIHQTGHYVDVQERVLYNNILGAIELSGVNFFYQNPLTSGKARYPWHGCPCCVGNIPRALLAIKDLMYDLSGSKDTLFVNHYVASEGTIPDVAGTPLRIEQQTEYPWKGDVALILRPETARSFTVKLRIPSRAESALYTATPDVKDRFTVQINGKSRKVEVVGGYVSLKQTWRAGDRIDLALPMDVQRIHADRRVEADRGRVALQRGPLAYSIESVDHDADVKDIVLPPDAPLEAAWRADLLGGVTVIECDKPKLLAVPNFARLNRGGRSQVWMVEDPDRIVPVDRAEGVAKPAARKDLEKRMVDRVLIGVRASETQHKLQGERTSSGVFHDRNWRHAGGGWFSYTLKVLPDTPMTLLCTYWGSDVGSRTFDVLVEGRKIATQKLNRNRPGKFFDVEYKVPRELIRGRETVTVRFEARPGKMAGGVFDCVMLRPK